MNEEKIKSHMRGLYKTGQKNDGIFEQDIDDFVQESIIKIINGRKATYQHLAIDFIRSRYGDVRTVGGAARQGETRHFEEVDPDVHGSESRDGRSNDELRALSVLSTDELDAILSDYQDQRSHYLRYRAKKKIKQYFDTKKARELLETENLFIKWIEI